MCPKRLFVALTVGTLPAHADAREAPSLVLLVIDLMVICED
jgi:hypothetical protein